MLVLILDRATGIDTSVRQLHFAARPSVPFDMLSINIGGQPDIDAIKGHAAMSFRSSRSISFSSSLTGCLSGRH